MECMNEPTRRLDVAWPLEDLSADQRADLDVALDAWICGNAQALAQLHVSSVEDLISLATHAYQGHRETIARDILRTVRARQGRHVHLWGAARVLALRTHAELRREFCDAMQIAPARVRVASLTADKIRIRVLATEVGGEDALHLAWWTSELAIADATRAAFHELMREAIEEAQEIAARTRDRSAMRIDRKGIVKAAEEYAWRCHHGDRLGEIFGTEIAPLRITPSGFAILRMRDL